MRWKYEIRTVDSLNTSQNTIPTAMAYCIVIALLMVVVRYSDGGCHVNDWQVFGLDVFYFLSLFICIMSIPEFERILHCLCKQILY